MRPKINHMKRKLRLLLLPVVLLYFTGFSLFGRPFYLNIDNDFNTQSDTINKDTNNLVPIGSNLLSPVKKWYILSGSIVSFVGDECCFYTEIFRLEDQDNNVYNVLRSTSKTESDWETVGSIRKDETGKIFFKSLENNIEGLLYDFSIQQGDSLYILNSYFYKDSIKVYVDSVDTYEYEGQSKKRIFLKHIVEHKILDVVKRDTIKTDTWIDGIGSMSGLMYSCYKAAPDDGIWHKILCLKVNEQLAYHDSNYKSCFLEGLVNNQIAENAYNLVKVYPNPVVNEAKLVLDDLYKNDEAFLEIYSLSGIKLVSKKLKNGEYIIQKANFEPGIYFFHVQVGIEKFYKGTFVIQ